MKKHLAFKRSVLWSRQEVNQMQNPSNEKTKSALKAANNVCKSPASLKDQGPWDAIVIGSGMGGMSCAAALSKYGARVLIFEQHYVPGGFTHVFSRKGFDWDVGVHCIGEMGPGEIPGEILKWLSNDGIQMKRMSPVYETFHFPDNFKITFPDSAVGFQKNLEKAFPDEKEAISKYFKLVRKVTHASKPYFALKMMPAALDKVLSRTIFRSSKKYWSLTTQEVLDGITTNAKLQAVLTAQWGYYGSIPSKSSFAIHALTARHFWNGGYYPEKGASIIADTLLNTVAKTGGMTCVRTAIEEIIVQNGKAVGVKTTTGEEFFAPKIVSAIGIQNTVSHLVPNEYKETEWGKELSSLGQSPSYICLNLGFQGDILAAGATISNQWFFDSWSMKDDIWDIDDPNSVVPIIYLSFPSLKDPHHDAGPEMRHTGEAVTFVPWKAFEKWKGTRRGNRDTDYLKFKKEIENRLLLQLRKHIPKLMDKVVHHELSTPLSTVFFTRAPQGAIYGLEAIPKRFTASQLRTRTPIKNLYLAGGDVATLGVTGAMIGGVLAAGTINPRVLGQLIEKPKLRRRKSLNQISLETT